MPINNFRDLRVWQLGMDLVEEIYRITGGFPSHEAYGLASQMRRSAVSIPSNIAEGNARPYRKEYLHHLSMSFASLAELDTQIEIAARLKYISQEQITQSQEMLMSLSKQLHSLRIALSNGHRKRNEE